MVQVSVIIPAYNAEDYIDECLESVRAQTLSDIEILVIDDGSTDETLSCVRKHADADSRVCVMTQENQYAGVARNKGIAEATGEYLYFLDADDWIEPNTLETLVALPSSMVAILLSHVLRDLIINRAVLGSSTMRSMACLMTPPWSQRAMLITCSSIFWVGRGTSCLGRILYLVSNFNFNRCALQTMHTLSFLPWRSLRECRAATRFCSIIVPIILNHSRALAPRAGAVR